MAIEAKAIQGVDVGGRTFAERWGTCGCEYYITTTTKSDPTDKTSSVVTSSVQVDFQDLMIDITQFRAVSLEQEVLPMERRMRWRNQMLEKLGVALSEITGYTNQIDTDKDPGDQKVDVNWTSTAKEAFVFCDATVIMEKDSSGNVKKDDSGNPIYLSTVTKWRLDEANQKVKTKTDRLNNDSSQDSTRLQSLVDHRDQAYQTATTLMTSISDTRTNLIRNIG